MPIATVSWRSIIAGVVTVVAVSIIMVLLGIALGFTVIDPLSNDPLDGLGLTFGFWSVLSILVSLAAGGYIGGYFAGLHGCKHGFLVWATTLLIASLFSGIAVSSAMKAIGSTVATVGSGAATVVSAAGGGIANLASGAIDSIQENVDLNFDPSGLRDDVTSVLRDTGVETPQPEYLSQVMRDARSDLRTTANQLMVHADNYESIITAFLDRQRERLANITEDIDRETAVTTLMERRDMSRADAEQAVDNAVSAYNTAVARVRDSVDEARQRVEDAKVHIDAAVQNARVKADQIAGTMAKTSLASAIALIIGAVVCCLAGWYGAGHAFRSNAIQITREETIVKP